MRRPSRRTLLAGVAAVLVPLPALAQTAAKEKVADALPKLEEFIRQVIDKKLVPGLSIAIVHRDEVVFLRAFGMRQVDKPEVVDVDTVFQLASVSKPLASTVVSALVSDGKVSWEGAEIGHPGATGRHKHILRQYVGRLRRLLYEPRAKFRPQRKFALPVGRV